MNFDALIQEGFNNGASPEDIAKAFTEAMNKAQESNKSKKDREDYIVKLRGAVCSAINRDEWTPEVISKAFTLAAAADFPKWSVVDLRLYEQSMVQVVREVPKMFNDLVVNPTKRECPHRRSRITLFDALDDLGKELADILKDDDDDSDDKKLKRFLKGINT